MVAETTPQGRKKFVLLCDFWDAYRNFELKNVNIIPDLKGNIRPIMFQALENAVKAVEYIDLKLLRSDVTRHIRGDPFVVTLEGGVIFQNNDVSIEITRACGSMKEVVNGPYTRMPRLPSYRMRQQFLNLRKNFDLSGKQRVVVCDDGIGTGGTLLEILRNFKDVNIYPDQIDIIVVTNPMTIKEIGGAIVNTIYKTDEEYVWLNERDLYWGLPRSGVSINLGDDFVGTGGVPYTFTENLINERIGISEENSRSFKKRALNANLQFWKELGKARNRQLTVMDCSRLHFFEKIYGRDKVVCDLILEAMSSNIEL